MTNILITGGAGFIGSCLAEELVKDKDNFVVIVDNLLTGQLERLPSKQYTNWKFIRCDVNNYREIASVMTTYQFDYVYHYAAVVGVQRTLDNPLLVLGDIEGIKNVLEISKNTGVKRVLYSSSSEVYGEPFEHPQNELTTPLNSRLPYAVVKNLGEVYLRSYYEEYGLNFTIFRFFNTYGTKQSKDFVMNRFIDAAIKGEDITIYGDGSQTRTFCYVEDNINACLNAMRSDSFANQTVNIGSDQEIAILDLAELIIQVSGSKSKLRFLPALKEGDMMRRRPDITKMRTLLGRDLTPLEAGIRRILEARNHLVVQQGVPVH